VTDETVILTLFVTTTLAMLGMIGAYAARYKRVPPGHAMVVYGRSSPGGRRYMVVRGGGRFIVPILESFQLISLEPFEIDLGIEDVVVNVGASEHDVRRLQVSVSAIAGISPDVELLQQSAGQLLGKTPDGIKRIVGKVLEGHTRGVLAIDARPEPDLVEVAEKIRGLADADLANMGIEVRSLLLKIRDTAAMRGHPEDALDTVTRELHQLGIRLRRVEEKLGISASG